MRKYILMLLLSVYCALDASAQNLQFHYFFDHTLNGRMCDKNYLQITFDMFKADKWGSFYTFTDFNFTGKQGNLGSIYWEISRNQNIGKLPVKLHIEYNGGVASSCSMPGAYFLGVNYPLTIGRFAVGANLSYKVNAFKRISQDGQLTLTWSGTVCKERFLLCGFVDMWTENKVRDEKSDEGKKFVVLFGPQGWYNLNPKIAIGTKINISYNMLEEHTIFVFPSLAVKWNF